MNRTPEEILAYCEEATDGPWGHERAHCMCLQCAYGRVYVDGEGKASVCVEVQEYDDAVFISLARTDLPRLAKEVLRLRALCGEAAEHIDSCEVTVDDELAFIKRLKAAAEGKGET